MGRYTEKHVKFETHSVGHVIWQETVKNDEYQKYTLQDLDCGKKTEKRGKIYTKTE